MDLLRHHLASRSAKSCICRPANSLDRPPAFSDVGDAASVWPRIVLRKAGLHQNHIRSTLLNKQDAPSSPPRPGAQPLIFVFCSWHPVHERLQPENPGCQHPGRDNLSLGRAESRRPPIRHGPSRARPVGNTSLLAPHTCLISSPLHACGVYIPCVVYALRRGSSRTLIENAVQSCLSISKLSHPNAAKARLMRAKARLAAGLYVGAHQGRSRLF